MTRGSADDPYVYPRTETLRNQLDIRDPDLLRIAEYAAVARRATTPPEFPVNAKGYLATHRHLFQDVYDWAGTIRTVGLRNPREPVEFARPMLIAGVLDKQFQDFAKQCGLAGLGARDFAGRAGEHLGELNAIHPFREGNGRTMRLHLRQLAGIAGHAIDDGRLHGPAWNEASRISFKTGNSGLLAAAIEGALTLVPQREPPPAAALSADARLVYAALASKVDREMTKLTPEARGDLRTQIARDLLAKEFAEGPVVLSAEQRHAAQGSETEPDPPRPPQPSRAPRRGR